MIVLKTSRELKIMLDAGRIAANALKSAGAAVQPGVSTWEIDRVARRYIEDQGAKPTFLGYGGFPASACVSVNEVVIHGIPSKSHIVKEGDIVSIDVGATYQGFVGDNAWTFPCGKVSEAAQALMDATRESLMEGIRAAVVGNRIGDVGSEPMINEGGKEVKTLQDGWTTVTADGKLSAHFEKSIAITPNGPVILTDPD